MTFFSSFYPNSQRRPSTNIHPTTRLFKSARRLAHLEPLEDRRLLAANAFAEQMPVNSPPVAVDDFYQIIEDRVLQGVFGNSLLSNDSDPDGDRITAKLVEAPLHGTLELRQSGNLLYVPDENFFGVDTFTYTANDTEPSNVATVTIEVLSEYDPAVAKPDDYTIRDPSFSVDHNAGLLANDVNVEASAISAMLVDDTVNGSLILNADGSFEYHNQGFRGTTTFNYAIVDETGVQNTATVTLFVDLTPIAVNDTYELDEDTELNVLASAGFLANDVDEQLDKIEVTLVTEPTAGLLVWQDDGAFVYTPNPEYSGPDSFTYFLHDGFDDSEIATVTLNVITINDLPIAVEETYFGIKDGLLEVAAVDGLLANDSDVDGPQLTAVLITPPSHGTLQIHGNGAFSYQPSPGFAGVDTFSYVADDSIDQSSAVEVSLIISSQTGVMINEFMAVNSSTVMDSDRDASDWIEIYNPTLVPVNLGGAYLSDDADVPKKWQFPNKVLQPGEYSLVFASGKDRRIESEEFHTNFKLSGQGEDLLLVLADGETIADAYLDYPEQRSDISFGRVSTAAPTAPLLEGGARVRYFVPTAADQATDWTAIEFDDSHWLDAVSTGVSPVIITEVSTGENKFVEIQSSSPKTINTTGWTVLINDAAQGINGVNQTVWSLPDTLEPQEIIYRTNNLSDNPWESPIAWSQGGPGWVMILDNQRQIQDFLVWGYSEAEIGAFHINDGPWTGISPGDHWRGAAVETAEIPITDQFYIDYTPGSATAPNTNGISGNGGFGLLRDATTGRPRAGLNVYQKDVIFSEKGVIPAPGTQAFESFDGWIDFVAGPQTSIELSGDAYQAFNFTALNSSTRALITYEFTGTAVTGGINHEDCWTRVELLGVESAVPAHSQGPGVVILSPTEVAIWTGANHGEDQGYVARWIDIVPTDPGQFSVVSNQYTGSTPGVGTGVASGPVGYGLTAIRLTATDVIHQTSQFSRTGATDHNIATDFTSLPETTPGGYNLNLDLPFHTELPSLTGIGFGAELPIVGPLITTDIGSQLRGVNPSLWTRIEFASGNPSLYESLSLRMKYDAGFVAYLNGIQIAKSNAPENLNYNSMATGERSNQELIAFQEFDISPFLSSIHNGTNILAVQALNSSANDPDLLMLPELTAKGRGYFDKASPEEINSTPILGFANDVQISKKHGFFSEPFQLELTTDNHRETIRYTTDGSEPTETTGVVYTQPLLIESTTVVRAAAFRANFVHSNTATQTYLFLDDVLTQSVNGKGPPGWPQSSVSGQRLNYGMDPEIVDSATWGPQLKEAFTAVPTMSIVIDLDHLFHQTSGIYVHAGSHGKSWERPTSIELIDPNDNHLGFQANAGLRIRGGFSRSGDNPKHAFRVFFRSEYGQAALEYPLFESEGADRFKGFDLRTTQNYSWSFGGDSRNAFLRDVFSRDIQRELEQPYTRSRYCHLYINGQYWGLFQTEERPEADYAATYFGGFAEDYDVIKSAGSTGGYTVEATDGNLDAYRRLFDEAKITARADDIGFQDNANYYRVQGRGPDGIIDPSLEKLLDVDNTIDFAIVNYFTGEADGAGGPGAAITNNFFATYNRKTPDGFKFYEHDSEHSLDTGHYNNVKPNTSGSQFTRFNPIWLHQQLMANSEYQVRFADRVQELFYQDGILTHDNTRMLLDARAAQIQTAIIAESARWGDANSGAPKTKNDWNGAVNGIRNWMTNRASTVIGQFKQAGWFPDLSTATFLINGTPQHGGPINVESELGLSGSQGTTIYYTLDDSDPRMVGGEVSPHALTYDGPITLTETTPVKARIWDSTRDESWSPLAAATFRVSTPPTSNDIAITEVHYNPYQAWTHLGEADVDNDEFEFIELTNLSDHPVELGGMKLVETEIDGNLEGVNFVFDPQTLAAGEQIVVVNNLPAFQSRYGTDPPIASGGENEGLRNGVYGGRLSNGGEHLTLISATGEIIQQFAYNDGGAWPGRADGNGSSLEVIDLTANYNDSDNWRKSTDFGGSPGTIGNLATSEILINEILANGNFRQLDTVELFNPTDTDKDLSQWYLSDSTDNYFKYQFSAGTIITAGGYLVLDERDFNAGDGTADRGFLLSSLGDDLTLLSADATGQPKQFIDRVEFSATRENVSLGRLNSDDAKSELVPQVRSTLGSSNLGQRAGDIIVSEVHYNPVELADEGLEFLELYNATGSAIELAPWRIEGGVEYELPTGVSLEAGETLVVVSFDPLTEPEKDALFRSTYGIGSEVMILGPWSEGNALDNDGERIDIVRNAEVLESGADDFAHILIDHVIYNDAESWPPATDGQGASLHRERAIFSGTSPSSWFSATPSPGTTELSLSPADDFNDDGSLNASDIDILLAAIGAETEVLDFDLDENGIVDHRDADRLVMDTLGTRYGDTNLDGSVSLDDLTKALMHFTGANVEGGRWAVGDTDGDGDVDSRDITRMLINFTPHD